MSRQIFSAQFGWSSMLRDQLVLLVFFVWRCTVSGQDGSCDLMPEGQRCVCRVNALRNIQNVFICMSAGELEIQDGRLEGIDPQLRLGFKNLHLLPVRMLVFTRVTISQGFLSDLISAISASNVVEVVFVWSTLESSEVISSVPGTPALSGVTLDNVTISPSLLHPTGQPFHHWLLGVLNRMAIVRSRVSEVSCGFALLLREVVDLDLSENELVDGFLDPVQCPITFPKLDCLNLNGNHLRSFQHLCVLLQGAPALKNLHASRNNFSQPPSECWIGEKSFRVLNLSYTELVQVRPYLSHSVEELDLRGNNLQYFDSPPQGLRKLYLSDNHLLRLPALMDAPQLQVLEVDGNQLTGLWDKPGPNANPLQVLEQLVTFRAGRNPYDCDCSIRDGLDLLKKDSDIVVDWPGDFVCNTPSSYKGTLLKDLRLSFFECHHTVAVCLIALSVLAVFFLVAGLIGCVFYKAAFGKP